ncbi:MerR family transcriptional regulator [Paenibacillus daejeonensis]|uniref:MerR family transcriptional regulator n=1 Tax=Paenibacillus daejeonensis TaxID=135193 RepID=UPI001FE08BDE
MSGVTVRTLHYYGEIGLLCPSMQTEAGHRLYSQDDVSRLYQILMLKRLGLPLENIQDILDDPAHRSEEVLQMQAERLEQQIQTATQLLSEINQLVELVQGGEGMQGEEVLKAMQLMKMLDSSYFKPLHPELYKQRLQQGYHVLTPSEEEAADLMDEFEQARRQGIPPEEDTVQKLARRWVDALQAHEPDHHALTEAAEQYYAAYPGEAAQYGMTTELYAYIRQSVNQLERDKS